MKINVDKELPTGTNHNYKKEDVEKAPKIIKSILNIDGVKGIYHVADFLAIERNGRYSWEEILPKVRFAFGEEEELTDSNSKEIDEHFGEVNVQIQTFKDIPLQVKLTTSAE